MTTKIDENNEYEALFVEISTNDTPYVIGLIYRPPGKNIEVFNSFLLTLLVKLGQKKLGVLSWVT